MIRLILDAALCLALTFLLGVAIAALALVVAALRGILA